MPTIGYYAPATGYNFGSTVPRTPTTYPTPGYPAVDPNIPAGTMPLGSPMTCGQSQPVSSGNPLGDRTPSFLSTATKKVEEMCAGTDIKTEWWKYALAAAFGYFVAKKR